MQSVGVLTERHRLSYNGDRWFCSHCLMALDNDANQADHTCDSSRLSTTPNSQCPLCHTSLQRTGHPAPESNSRVSHHFIKPLPTVSANSASLSFLFLTVDSVAACFCLSLLKPLPNFFLLRSPNSLLLQMAILFAYSLISMLICFLQVVISCGCLLTYFQTDCIMAALPP